jgi:adenylate cyclase
MTTEQRRLAAIVSADVVGYSRMMGRDEAGTVARLRRVRAEGLQPVLDRRGGRVVKLTGDGALIEFASAVEALSAAIEFQQAMTTSEAERPKAEQLVFRVGVHLGDVIVDGNDLYGDGVNVAARLEAQAAPGGITISGAVHDATEGRLKARFEDLGRLVLKNIERPMQAYAVQWQANEWPCVSIPAGSARFTSSDIPLSLPDKPSIAVLPFQNMSGDPEQEYFADGMVEDIITALCQTRQLFVIARNSSFSYKGKSPDIRQVGRELGVRYVLEGSVRKAGNRVRITGQLIDSLDGAHIWADRFEGQIEDVFDLQDRVTSNVVASILPYVERAEIARSHAKPTSSLVAYDYYLRGLDCSPLLSKQSNDEALAYYQQAIAADPRFALPYVRAANCYSSRKALHWLAGDPALETAEAMRLARKALHLDPSDPRVLAHAGWIIGYVGENLDEGAQLVASSVELDPSLFIGWNYRGWLALGIGDDGARDYFLHALRLSPRHPALYNIQAGIAVASLFRRDCEEALVWTGKVLPQHPRELRTLQAHAAALALLGQTSEAHAASRSILEIVPNYRISTLEKHLIVKRPEILDTLREGLRLAGIPE